MLRFHTAIWMGTYYLVKKSICTSEDKRMNKSSVTRRSATEDKCIKNKVTVWCGMSTILGSYFFDNHRGQTENVNSVKYAEMISKVFRLKLQNSNTSNDGIPQSLCLFICFSNFKICRCIIHLKFLRI